MTDFQTYMLIAFFGILLKILGNIQSLKKKAKTANHSFHIKEYFSDDWPAIAASFVVVGLLTLGLDELLAFKPAVAKLVKWMFFFVGHSGAGVVLAALSVTNKKIMAVIDVKTNIADGVQPAIDKENMQGAREIIKDEQNKKD